MLAAFKILWMENYPRGSCKIKGIQSVERKSSNIVFSAAGIYFRLIILWAKNKMPSFMKRLRSLRKELRHDKRLNFKFNKQRWNTAEEMRGLESNCF